MCTDKNETDANWIANLVVRGIIDLADADEMIQRSLADALQKIANQTAIDIVEIPFKHYILPTLNLLREVFLKFVNVLPNYYVTQRKAEHLFF